MRSIILMSGIMCAMLQSALSEDKRPETRLYPAVETYLQQRVAEFESIPAERKVQLDKIAAYVKECRQKQQAPKLVFICTHNSRRSHLSQVWAAVAAHYYQVEGVQTYSGGTEATAFNPRAVSAIERAGLKIEKREASMNPRYSVRFHETSDPLICFSKAYRDPPNPREGFCAVMTCSQADQACPVVLGCSARLAIPYEDPKVADGTPEESAKYDERCAQICRELLFLFHQVVK